MDAYKRWVRRNKDYVHSLESLANIALQIVFAAVQLSVSNVIRLRMLGNPSAQ